MFFMAAKTLGRKVGTCHDYLFIRVDSCDCHFVAVAIAPASAFGGSGQNSTATAARVLSRGLTQSHQEHPVAYRGVSPLILVSRAFLFKRSPRPNIP